MYTKGPWHNWTVAEYPGGNRGYDIGTAIPICRVYVHGPDAPNRPDSEQSANARLIAAAPLMKLFVDNAADVGDNMATLIKEAADGKRDLSDVWNQILAKTNKS